MSREMDTSADGSEGRSRRWPMLGTVITVVLVGGVLLVGPSPAQPEIGDLDDVKQDLLADERIDVAGITDPALFSAWLKLTVAKEIDEGPSGVTFRVRSVSFDGEDVQMPVVKVQASIPAEQSWSVDALSDVAFRTVDSVFQSSKSVQASVYVSVSRTNVLGFRAPKDVLLVKMRRDRWTNTRTRGGSENGRSLLQNANYVFLSSDLTN